MTETPLRAAGVHRGPRLGADHIHLPRARGGAGRPMLRVAILGTGRMGAAIAGRLDEVGVELVLWNRTRERAAALGIGHVTDSPAAAVRDADLAISSLTDQEAVRAAYLGPDGALSAAEGKLLIEMSTAGPDLIASLVDAVTAAGARLVDAPILGAPPVVREGKAAILVGGADSDAKQALPILRALGTVRHVGPSGSGARLKLVSNSMLAEVILAAAELQVAGEQAGLEPDDVFWVLQRMAPVLAGRRRGIVEGQHEPTLFALRDLRKDLDLAIELFGRSAARTPVTAHAQGLLAAAARRDGDLDITAVARPYRDMKPANDADPSASPSPGTR